VALASAELALARTRLYAPAAGTVTQVTVDAGEMASPGQMVAVLATLDELQVRTTDLTELDVVHIELGQAAVVTVDALPGVEFAGHVSEIGLESVIYRGDVT
jgi:multidrug resistance efflux pump